MSKQKFVPKSVQPSVTSPMHGYIIILLLVVIAVLLYRSVFNHEDGGQLVRSTEVVSSTPTSCMYTETGSVCVTGQDPPILLTALPDYLPPLPTISP